MRFHSLGLPHTVTHRDYSLCAYTQKVLKFNQMMRDRGHEILHYGHEDSRTACSEHITVITNADLTQAYGSHDWRQEFFKFDITDHAHRTFHANAIKEIQKRKQPGDFLLCWWGWGHKAIADAHPDLAVVEPGIGYRDQFARWRVFESHAIRTATMGPNSISTCDQDWYWRVIPNYFDLSDFEYSDNKSDYILFLGRVYDGKGIDIAIEATAAAGKRLKIAGQNGHNYLNGQYPDHCEYLGSVGPDQRRELLRDAQALIIGSKYNEPFAGVQVEAFLSGTPVISPEWGAFREYNKNNITGFHCWTFRDWVEACENVQYLNPIQCRLHGEQFSLENIAPRYERYFQDILDVYQGQGWYQR